MVHRIVSSTYIRRSARLRDMFVYLCERVLDDAAEDIHELEVGHQVFGRPTHYDTTADNIVRVHASSLRKRLSEYFETEGRDEPLVIEIPRGNYAPVFRPRTPARSQEERTVESPVGSWDISTASLSMDMLATSSAIADQVAAPALPTRRLPAWGSLTAGLLAALFAGLSIFLLLRGTAARRSETASTIAGRPAVTQFWSEVFRPGNPAQIVLDDASLDFYQQAMGHPVSLSEYFDRSYLRTVDKAAEATKLDPNLVQSFILKRQSNFVDATLIWKLSQTAAALGGKASIQFARDFSFRQVKSGNLLLLGNGESNPWIQAFGNHLTLNWAFDPALASYYPVDTKAAPGESEQYRASSQGPGTHEGYATVSLLPNLGGTGNVLILSGTGGSAIGAAADYLLDETAMERLRARLTQHPGANYPYFEVLLKIEKGSIPKNVTVVLCRSPLSMS